mgnify:FL=1
MRLIDLIKKIKIPKFGYELMTIKLDEKEFLLKTDYTQYKRDSIRIPLEELNIEIIYHLPFELNLFNRSLWITKELEYMIIWDYHIDEISILDIKELKEQDISYLVLKYGKIFTRGI